MPRLDPGDVVPDLGYTDQTGQQRSVLAEPGRWRVVFFYPKDNTPGCTTENRDFSALAGEFAAAGAELIGVSRDSAESHRKFCLKQELTHSLAADTDGSLCEAFDVIREKSLYGRRFLGIERSTFLIDPHGVVRHVWRKVKVKDHASAVLTQLRSLQQ